MCIFTERLPYATVPVFTEQHTINVFRFCNSRYGQPIANYNLATRRLAPDS